MAGKLDLRVNFPNTLLETIEKEVLIGAAAIFIILMLRASPTALPAVKAFSNDGSHPAVDALFYRNDCGPFQDVQARYGQYTNDNTTSNSMTINVLGSQTGYAYNNTAGDFKFDSTAEGPSYMYEGVSQFPGIEAFVSFHGYSLIGVGLTVTAAYYGEDNGTAPAYERSMSASYPGVDFSSTTDEFNIIITQTSTAVIAHFHLLDSSGNIS